MAEFRPLPAAPHSCGLKPWHFQPQHGEILGQEGLHPTTAKFFLILLSLILGSSTSHYHHTSAS